MATITFYEKPGCAGNAKQQALLLAAGHELEVRNLLTHGWTGDELMRFFGGLPVPLWFNQAAPRIKAGDLNPEVLTVEQALRELVREPLLIRRPLMESGGECRVGFDTAEVDAWVGLPSQPLPKTLEGCAAGGLVAEGETHAVTQCKAPR
jgi:nitrogenase-associated protein